MNEAERRGYKKVRITDSLIGWPTGSIAWLDTESEDRDVCYNADCSDYWYHRLGSKCEFVEERPTETGTLAELNVKPGDVVENPHGFKYTISINEYGKICDESDGIALCHDATWRIISRANQDTQTEASPVRTVTRTEIVPGVYGRVSVSELNEYELIISVWCEAPSAEDLTAAIATLTEIRDAMK